MPIAAPLFLSRSDASSLMGLLDSLTGEELLFSDLSVGSYEGFTAARQLADQLDVELSHGIFARSVNQSSSPSERVAAWVDAEGRGDALIAKAHGYADTLATAASDIDANIVIILPRSGERVCEEDDWFLYFLAAALKTNSRSLHFFADSDFPDDYLLKGLELQRTMITPSGKPEAGQAPPLIAVMPGLLTQNQVVQLASERLLDDVELLPLRNGHYLISPTHRLFMAQLSDSEVCRACEEALLITRNEPILVGLNIAKMERGLELGCEISDLVAAAWQLCGEGGLDIAERYFAVIAKYLKTHSYNDYLQVAVEMQSFRIAAQRFDIAATLEEPDPEHGDPKLSADVFFTLGWARILNGDAKGSAAAFAESGDRQLKLAENAIDLYLLNIFALSLLRNGDWDGAMHIEQGIAKRLTLLPSTDWHLHYINNFNLARLYRIKGELKQALIHVREVLKTTEGVQTDSDHIYFNLTLGDLAQRQEQQGEALVYFWRAAMHFLCNPVPEAIGWRTLMSVLGKRIPMEVTTPNLIADGLCSKLFDAASDVGLALVSSSVHIPFQYVERGLGLATDGCRVLSNPYMGALVSSPEDQGKPTYDSAAYAQLRSFCMQIFDEYSANSWDWSTGSIMFSPLYSVEIEPQQLDQTACLVLKYGLTQVVADSAAEENMSLEAAASRVHLRLAPAVAEVKNAADKLGAVASFKRYKEDLEFRGWAPALLRLLRDAGKPVCVTEALEKGVLQEDETGYRGIGHQLSRLESQGVILMTCE